jgi:hypothetical protein
MTEDGKTFASVDEMVDALASSPEMAAAMKASLERARKSRVTDYDFDRYESVVDEDGVRRLENGKLVADFRAKGRIVVEGKTYCFDEPFSVLLDEE